MSTWMPSKQVWEFHGEEHLVIYMRCKLTPTEQCCGSIEWKTLEIKWAKCN